MQNRLSVYFAGDTDLFEGMKEVGQDFDLDMALIPVWGYGHRLGEGHLTPFTAAQALNHLRPRVAVPIHWGSLRYWGPEALWKRADYLSQPPHLFAQHAGHLSPQTTVQVLQPGEGTALH
jgi:L-ascorbate metabolism protein UlaG (beta-lactamase superfamily)